MPYRLFTATDNNRYDVLNFDGTDDYINVSNIDTSDSVSIVTIAFWTNPNILTGEINALQTFYKGS